ncbi:DUF3843 family protein [Palleniella muris]|uniref:DUF3843 family protein n=1 Tax=Palleniella muris TaxID=3038145 RepID=UPI001441CDF3|nr:DUF3843 family protein [Palleniella muris]
MAYQLKIKLLNVSKPPVWRRILIPADYTFDQLHLAIQEVMGWENAHLYQFKDKIYDGTFKIGTLQEDDFLGVNENIIDSGKTKIKDYIHEKRKKLKYTYDFGDDWHHDVELEETRNENLLFPLCLAGKGACPPEDCGGPWGYEMLKEQLAEGEGDEEYDWLIEDMDFDPKKFDTEEANARLVMAFRKTATKPTAKGKAQNGKRKKVIFPKDFINFRPDGKPYATDSEYADIANRVYYILFGTNDGRRIVTAEECFEMAMILTLYYEDCISGLGLWQAFVNKHRELYGKWLPFYDIDEAEYYPDEVNLPDVKFLLWLYLTSNNELTLTNPFLPWIEEQATEIHALFESEFEKTAMNEPLVEQFYEMAGSNDFFVVKELLTWLCEKAYLLYYSGGIEAYINLFEEKLNDRFEQAFPYSFLHYATMSMVAVSTPIGPLALKPKEWLCEMCKATGNDKNLETLSNMDYRDFTLYRIVGITPETLKVLSPKDETMEIAIDSINPTEQKSVKNCTYLTTSLVHFNGLWNVNGLCSMVKKSDDSNAKEHYDEICQGVADNKKTTAKNKEMCEDMMSKNHGKRIIFNDNRVVIIAEDNSILEMKTYHNTLKSPDNPYYDKEAAQNDGVKLILNRESMPAAHLRMLIDTGCFADAMIPYPGDETRGKRLLQENMRFLARCLRREEL